MNLIAKCLGGSRAYHLNTPESDTDLRGVFLNTELSKIVGLEKHEHQESSEVDTKYKELRRFFNLLRQSNTEAVEILFCEEFLDEPDPLFLEVQEKREQFLDTEQMFKCLRGYMQGERRLMLGERTGTLGGKRKAALDKYGYSYKNLVQGIRLAYSGMHFFNTRVFPVNLEQHLPNLQKHLLNIKTNPETLSKEDADRAFTEAESELVRIYEARDKSKDLKFNLELANDYVLRFYYPLIKQHYLKGWTGFRDIQEMKGMS